METLAEHLKTWHTEKGSVSLSRICTGELHVHDLEGDALLILRVLKYCRDNHPGETITAAVAVDNPRMFSVMRAAKFAPVQVVFSNKV